MQLRPYQEELVNKIKEQLKLGKKSVVAVLGCGGGKSVVQGSISKSATEKGNKVLFLVHRKELCHQIKQTFIACGVDLKMCHIFMVQTITKRLNKISKDEYSLIITDECHHSSSKTYTDIYNYFDKAIRLGFTATPQRMKEGGLGKTYESLVEGVSTEWLIENKYLSPYKYYGVTLIDTSNVKVVRGDYDAKQVNELAENTEVYVKSIEMWEKYAKNKKTIIYCNSIKASQDLVLKFKLQGYKAEHLDGTTPKLIREEKIQKFRDGLIDIISNVELFSEGLDVPDCECVVLLRPTKSLTLFIQQSMRSMRYKENKTAYILDCVNNVKEHGLPDMTREWTLEEKKKNKKNIETMCKQCPECYMYIPLNVMTCPDCNYKFKTNNVSSGKDSREEGEMIEITKEYFKSMKYSDYKQIKTFSDLCSFQKSKGYKFGWTIRKAIELKIQVPSKYKYMANKFYGVTI